MSVSKKARFDTLRSATAASIGATYTAVGSALPEPAVILSFKNNTNGDVIISTNAVNDMLYLVANSFTIYDIRTNSPIGSDFMFPQGTIFYAKDGTTATTAGTFYIEVVIIQVVP